MEKFQWLPATFSILDRFFTTRHSKLGASHISQSNFKQFPSPSMAKGRFTSPKKRRAPDFFLFALCL
jgi:hypothetical protein